jgi:hypothetical protein
MKMRSVLIVSVIALASQGKLYAQPVCDPDVYHYTELCVVEQYHTAPIAGYWGDMYGGQVDNTQYYDYGNQYYGPGYQFGPGDQINQFGNGPQINNSGNYTTAIGETAIAINGGDGNSININQ